MAVRIGFDDGHHLCTLTGQTTGKRNIAGNGSKVNLGTSWTQVSPP